MDTDKRIRNIKLWVMRLQKNLFDFNELYLDIDRENYLKEMKVQAKNALFHINRLQAGK